MKSLRIFEYDQKSFDKGALGYLPDVTSLKISREINGDWTAEAEYPSNGSGAELIEPNRIISAGGQGFRIVSVERAESGSDIIKIYARHVMFDMERIHLPSVPAYIGKAPQSILEGVFEDTGFTVLDDADIIDPDYRVDLFEQDKLNPYQLLQSLISAAGFGEIYADNYSIALVNRLGGDKGAVLDTSVNLSGLDVTRDFSGVVTRLYPYGANDLTVSSANSGCPYIESENADEFGILEGFTDLSDYTSADELLERALWEFDEANENRIDMPSVTVGCEACAVFREGEEFELGDTVRVRDRASGLDTRLRITAYEQYPLSPEKTRITLGRVRTSLFSYLKQFNLLTSRYDKISASNGSVMTGKLSGIINSSVNPVQGSAGYFTIEDDLMTVIDSDGDARAELGCKNDKFIFNIYDGSGEKAVSINDDGDAEFAGKMTSASVFSGSIDTESSVSVGDELKIRTATDGTRCGIFFYTPSGKLVGDILMISGSSDSAYMVIEAPQVLVNNVDFDELSRRVSALESAAG